VGERPKNIEFQSARSNSEFRASCPSPTLKADFITALEQMPRANIKPADQATEHYRRLIRQNQDFVVRTRAAIESGVESAAAMTATVRTRREGKRVSPNSDSSQVTA
jgi:hypothetical protein